MRRFIPGRVKGEMMTKIFEKILITTDGSVKNQPVVKKGLELARELGSTTYVVYVIDETPFTSSQVEVLTDEVYLKLKDEGEKAIEQVKKIADGVKLETFILSGRPAHAITKFAVKNKVDLIVVGSQGKSGLERLLLGSVAESIIRTAECMVLVVKSK
ncbi:MAG: universal stress protein [Methanoregula sp.]|uniref:universal stress protein n=2 Tax=Methanoregula sp. TaxID=2052170 RepID=UPI003BAF078C